MDVGCVSDVIQSKRYFTWGVVQSCGVRIVLEFVIILVFIYYLFNFRYFIFVFRVGVFVFIRFAFFIIHFIHLLCATLKKKTLR